MKLNLIAAAAALASLSQIAAAAPVTVAQAAAAAAARSGGVRTQSVLISGASALQASVKNAFGQAACATPADLTEFQNGSNVKAYACVIKAGGYAGLPAGQVGVLFHTVTDGSLKSIEGMSSDAAKQVTFVNDSFASCTGSGTAYTGCTAAKAPSQGGFSDVERALFSDVLASSPPAGVDLTKVVATGVNAGQSFGIAVSIPLYRALQAAQSMDADCTNDTVVIGTSSGNATATVTVNGADDFSAACQPSITKQQYASTVAANSKAGISSLFAPAHWTHIGVTDAQPVHIVRRPATSGTQAASNAFFLGKNCVAGSDNPLVDADDTTGLIVDEITSTGTALTTIGNGALAGSASPFRIGVASAENAPTGTAAWRFIKLDGVAVNEDAGHRKATVEMRYDFAGEFALHRYTQLPTPTLTPKLAFDVMGQLAADMGKTANTNLRGVFIRPVDEFYAAGDPALERVHQATRGGNWCQPFKFQF